MNLKFKRTIAVLLTFALVLTLVTPVFASIEDNVTVNNTNLILERSNEFSSHENELLQSAIDGAELVNLQMLSRSDQQLVEEATRNPNSYLVLAEIVLDYVVLIYNTSDENVIIAITDGYVEIIHQLDEGVFLINGEKVIVEIEILPAEYQGFFPLYQEISPSFIGVSRYWRATFDRPRHITNNWRWQGESIQSTFNTSRPFLEIGVGALTGLLVQSGFSRLGINNLASGAASALAGGIAAHIVSVSLSNSASSVQISRHYGHQAYSQFYRRDTVITRVNNIQAPGAPVTIYHEWIGVRHQ